jgi:hypothetical protein
MTSSFISDYKGYILELAQKHQIVYQRTVGDELADKFTELSGDTVIQDDICDLLVAMVRQKVISVEEMMQLQVGYLREKKLGKE